MSFSYEGLIKGIPHISAWPPSGIDAVLWYMGFSNDASAPLTSPWTAALDGHPRAVGQAVLTQDDGQYSTSGGALVIPAQSTPAWVDQGFIGKDANGDGFARVAGLAYVWKANHSSFYEMVGYFDGAGIGLAEQLALANFYSLGTIHRITTSGPKVKDVIKNEDNVYGIIVRLEGYIFLINDELVYVVNSGTDTPLYPSFSNHSGAATMPTAALMQVNTSVAKRYPDVDLSDLFTDDSGSPVSDGAGHNEGKRKGQTCTAQTSGALATINEMLANNASMDVADWTAHNSATLTNPATGIIRVARNGTNDPGMYNDELLTVGRKFRVTGEAQSDGNATPRLINGATLWSGTTSTDWQRFNIEFVTSVSAYLFFRAITSTGTEYANFRNLSVTELGSAAFDATYQNSVPLNDTADGGVFNSVDSYVQLPAAALDGPFDDTEGEIEVRFSYADDTPASSQYLFCFGANTSNQHYAFKSPTAGRISVNLEVGGVTKTWVINGLSADTAYRLKLTWSGGFARVYLDDVEQGSAQALGSGFPTLTDSKCVIGGYNSAAPTFYGEVTLFRCQFGSYDPISWSLDDAPHGASLGDGITHLTGTWSSDGTAAINSPVAGAELLTNGDFSAWTGDDPDNWTVYGESGGDPEISEVDAGQAHGGTNTTGEHCNIYTTGTSTRIYQSVMTVGKWYRYAVDVDTQSSGTVNVLENGDAGSVTIDGVGEHIVTVRARNAAAGVKRTSGLTDVTLASTSLKELILSELITCQAADSTRYPYIESDIPVDDGYQAGIALFVDDHTNPTAGVLVYLDNNDDKIKVWDIGASSELSSTSVTPSDGATLVCRVLESSPNTINIFYNDAVVDDVSYTPETGALQNGLFGTGGASGASERFVIYPTNAQSYGDVI